MAAATITGKSGSGQSLGVRLPHVKISGVWIRFLLAIFGLMLAFAFALFSTASRNAGNMWATLVFASLALGIALIIGLTTVPYLARRVAGSRLRNAVDYKVTRLGVIYVVVVLFIGIAALNTGNNLLYVIVAAMMAAILASGVLSAIVLRDLELDIKMPRQVFAGVPFTGRLLLRNPRRWAPGFSVSVVPTVPDKTKHRWQWKETTFAFPPKRPGEKQWFRLPDRKLQRIPSAVHANQILSGTTYFPYIPAREVIKAEMEIVFGRRGIYKEESFKLASGFPFAFFIKTRHVPLTRETVVYPSVLGDHDPLALLSSIAGEIEAFIRGSGNDLHRLREYMPDDSARHVDWKATAKTGTLKLREFSRPENRKLRIIFDNPAPGMLSSRKYERAVATVASLAWHVAAANPAATYVTQQFDASFDVNSFLTFLATVQPTTFPSLLDDIDPVSEFNILVTARSSDEIPSHVRSSSYCVFIGDLA